MKKVGRSVSIIFLIIFLTITLIFEVKADSGFDGSYDSGASSSYYSDSYSSSSSSDYSFSSSSSSRSSVNLDGNGVSTFLYMAFSFIYIIIHTVLKGNLSSEKIPKKESKAKKNTFTIIAIIIYGVLVYYLFGIVDLFFSVIFLIIFGLAQFDNHRVNLSNKKSTDENKLENQNIIQQASKNTDHKEFYDQVFKTYKDIQIAWMNNTLEEVRSLLSDEMFNMYKMQLLTLTTKNQKNMMENINFVEANIMDIRRSSNKEEIDVKLVVTCRDYIIDINTNKVLRGDKNIITEYTYKLSLIKTNQKTRIKTCPNCGSKIENHASTKCEYCNSIIIQDTNNYVLTEKKVLNQRRK